MKDKIKNSKLHIFPEGASCFSQFGTRLPWSLYRYGIKPYLHMHAINIMKKLNISRRYLLGSQSVNLKEYIGNSKYFCVLDQQMLQQGYKKCAKYITEIYDDLNYKDFDNCYFHPCLSELNTTAYGRWFEQFLPIIESSFVVAKLAPKDRINHPLQFKERVKFIDPKYSLLPGELITIQANMSYIGYYSSMILSFRKNKIHLIAPPDDKIKKSKDKVFKGLKTILN
ncbi:hypothetical protein [Synechococcus sp. M16.1]|uniref:hypothetical protein n=1 Tax=Synechococcus sp. M16.1 TaxID=1442553 RepID=UPI001648DEE0|nr:hypothetical protein [Synechococcus sp. M16.1]